MAKYPSTIHTPDLFEASAGPWFDGVFDWSWTQGAFGNTRITPMDFDGVVERKGNFLIFETKGRGAQIPQGQLLTLTRAWELGCFTVFLIYGKAQPEHGELWPAQNHGGERRDYHDLSVNLANKICKHWFGWADTNPAHKAIDVSFLQRRVITLQSQLTNARHAAEQLVHGLNGRVIWGKQE